MNFIRVLLKAVGLSSLPPDIETLQLKVNFKTRGIFRSFAVWEAASGKNSGSPERHRCRGGRREIQSLAQKQRAQNHGR
jgi:hypothetical protein